MSARLFSFAPTRGQTRRVTRCIRLLLSVSLLLSLAPSVVGASNLRWLRARTAHFVLFSNSDADSVLRLARGLERMAHVVELQGIGSSSEERTRTVLVALPDKRSFEPNLPERDGHRVSLSGYAMHLPFGNWIGFAEYDPRGRMVAHHEYAHTIVSNVFQRVPLCLNEGLAEFLSTFEVGDRSVSYGHPIPWHQRALKTMKPMSLDELFEVDENSRAYHGGDVTVLFYAESWALAHYLSSKPGGSGHYLQFAHIIDRGVSPRMAFVEAYPQENWERLPDQLRSYVESDAFHYTEVGFIIPLDEEIVELRDALPGEVATHIGIWRVMESGVDTAGTHAQFQEALRENPEFALAHAGNGLLAMCEGQPEQALAQFRGAAGGAADAQTLSIAGISMLQMSFQRDSSGRDRLTREAYALLERSVALDSTDANALAWYGRSALAAGVVTARVRDALRRATLALPADPSLARAAKYAEAYAPPTHGGESSLSTRESQTSDRVGADTPTAAQLADSLTHLVRAGRFDQASALLDQLDQEATTPEQTNEIHQARFAIQQYRELHESMTEYNLGVGAANRRDYIEALRHFRRVRDRAPNDSVRAEASNMIAQISGLRAYDRGLESVRLGDLAEALRWFEQSQRLAQTPELRAQAARRVTEVRAALSRKQAGGGSRR